MTVSSISYIHTHTQTHTYTHTKLTHIKTNNNGKLVYFEFKLKKNKRGQSLHIEINNKHNNYWKFSVSSPFLLSDPF